jgi:pimeloyl-ACP methyl ester carboxylesterase
MSAELPRRAFLGALAAVFAARRALAQGIGELDVQGLAVGEHRVVVALPRAAASPVPLVVLLHGLAETASEELGSRAWVDRYGLATSVERLARAPSPPYRGLAFACPYMPKLADRDLPAYGGWLARSVVPAARELGASRIDASLPVVAGCSLGARVALDVFLSSPEAWRAWAGVQTAIGRGQAPGYASRLARAGKPLLVETSTLDPFHDASLDLAAALSARGAKVDLVTLPGPHDQPWLRQSGTPRMLAWLDALPTA